MDMGRCSSGINDINPKNKSIRARCFRNFMLLRAHRSVEQDYLESIKDAQRKLEGKMKKQPILPHEDCKVVVGCRPPGGNVRYSALEPGTRSLSALADALSAYHVCPILDFAILVPFSRYSEPKQMV